MGIELKKKNYQYYAHEQGTNSRLDELQESVLNIKLNKIKKYIKERQANAEKYYKLLKNSSLILPLFDKKNSSVFYEYVVRHKKRNHILTKLKKKKIFLKVTYPYPIYKMTPYKKFHKIKKLENTEKYSKEIFSLPVYPGIRPYEIKKICKNIMSCVKK